MANVLWQLAMRNGWQACLVVTVIWRVSRKRRVGSSMSSGASVIEDALVLSLVGNDVTDLDNPYCEVQLCNIRSYDSRMYDIALFFDIPLVSSRVLSRIVTLTSIGPVVICNAQRAIEVHLSSCRDNEPTLHGLPHGLPHRYMSMSHPTLRGPSVIRTPYTSRDVALQYERDGLRVQHASATISKSGSSYSIVPIG